MKQRNKYVPLLEKTKEGYYQNLNEKNVMDSKKFWQTVKTLLSDKTVFREKINLKKRLLSHLK